jgi:HEAT repeat protein
MNNQNAKRMKSVLLTVLLGAAFALVPSDALAGRGSSLSAIDSASKAGRNAIIKELERAEKLICPKCVPIVRKLLDHEDYDVREAAAWWMTKRPYWKLKIAKESEIRLRGTDATLARNAADVLGAFQHADAVPVLSEAVNRSDFPSSTRAAALKALGLIGSGEGEPAILTGLRDPGADARREAIIAYSKLRGRGTGVYDGAPLAAMAQDSDASVRETAARVIGRYRLAGARVDLEKVLLTDSNPIARRNAAWALGRIGDAGSRNALVQASKNDTHSYVRSAADMALRTVR